MVVVLGYEDDLTGPQFDVRIPDACDSVPGDEVFELLRVRVPVDVVLRARGKDGDPEDRMLRPDGIAGEQPAHVHVDPAVLGAQCAVPRRRLEAGLQRMVADTADRLGHVVTSGSQDVQHN